MIQPRFIKKINILFVVIRPKSKKKTFTRFIQREVEQERKKKKVRSIAGIKNNDITTILHHQHLTGVSALNNKKYRKKLDRPTNTHTHTHARTNKHKYNQKMGEQQH